MKTLVSYRPNGQRTAYPQSFMNDFFNIDNLFSRGLTQTIGNDNPLNSPHVNVVQNETGFKLEVAAPGLAKENFQILLEEDNMIVAAEQKTENEETSEKYTRREFNYNSFKRSFRLPENVNRDEISASYENGILEIGLPFMNDADLPEKTKTIEIS